MSRSSNSDNFVDNENSPHMITQRSYKRLQLCKSILAFILQQWNLFDSTTKVGTYPSRSKAYTNFVQNYLSLVIVMTSKDLKKSNDYMTQKKGASL